MIKDKLRKRREQSNINASERLRMLREKRISLEGQANLSKLKREEKDKIRSARKEKFVNKTEIFRRVGSKMKTVGSKLKDNIPKSNSELLFGDSTGAKNLYGGSSSAHNKLFGNDKKDVKDKPKRISITIR